MLAVAVRADRAATMRAMPLRSLIDRSARFACIAAIAAAMSLSGCREAAEDGAVAAPPPPAQPRIVALSPALAIVLSDLGAADRIVARHSFDLALPKSLPVVGDQSGIDYEALLRVEPTHVVLEWGSRGLPPRLLELAERRGFVVLNYPMLTLDDIRNVVRALPTDAALGDAAASRAGDLLAQMDEAWAPDAAFGERVGRALCVYWTSPVGAAGPGSFHVQMIEAMGGRSAIGEGAAYITLDVEDVRRLDPDSIILFMPGAEPSRLNELLAPLERAGVRAVREGRIALINHPHCQTPSTAMIEAARLVRAATLDWE